MDPDEAFKRLNNALDRARTARRYRRSESLITALVDVAEAAQDLSDWLTTGGYLPFKPASPSGLTQEDAAFWEAFYQL